jgi:hypothetical protein
MNHLKIFEDFGLNKDWVISALDDDELRDIYEYLLSVNSNPKIYKISIDDLDYTWLSKSYINRILYTDNKDLKHRFLIRRSTQPKDLPYKIEPDIEKEKEIQTKLASKKYNL